MLKKLFSISWFWALAIAVNLVCAAHSFVVFDEEVLMFNLLCAALCSLGWISAKHSEHI